MIISGDQLQQVLAHCKSVYPNEACGILAGRGGIVEKVYLMTNVEHSPVSYCMDPKEQFRVMKEMRQEDLKMPAIFHSHPQSPAYPSSKDINLACYSDSLYVIVSLIDPDNPVIRVFEISDGVVIEKELKVVV